MKTTLRAISALILLSAAACLPGCAPDDPWEQQYQTLLQQATALEQRHCRLKASTDSLWDATTVQLARALPADFPAIDRDIFLKARNADHIRMFMSYQQVDSGVKDLVDRAGRQDAILAAQIRTLLEQQQQFEQQKMQFLQAVAEADPTASRQYVEEFRGHSSGLCQ